MKQKLLALVVLLICGVSAAKAQKISVEAFNRIDRDMGARVAKVRDINSDLCALIKIETIETGFEFSGCIIEKTEQKTGEIWVFVSPGVKFLTIKHKDFGVLRNYNFPQSIESGVVYQMKLSTEAKEVKIDTSTINKAVDSKIDAKMEEMNKKLAELEEMNKKLTELEQQKQNIQISVSTENVYFGKDGGRRTITVSTNGEWRIGVGTASWAHTSISGNTITLRVDENNSGDERTDYFIVVAGDKDIRINITQAGGPSAEVNRVWVEHNEKRTGYNSVFNPYYGWQQVPYTYNVMRIHVDFDVNNMKGKTIRVCAFFYDDDGDKLTTSNNQFRAPDGHVTVQNTGTVTYENSNWSDFILEIPYAVMQKGDNKFYIQIQDNKGNTLANSSYEYFTVN